MRAQIRRVEYFYTTVKDRPGEAYQSLSMLASANVNLLAFNITPIGPEQTHLVLFPDNVEDLARHAERSGLVLSAPQHAFLVQGHDWQAALVGIHEKLTDAHINVYASNGVSDGRGGFGYVLYVKEGDFENAANVLGV